jgi:hypothetical protein
MEFKEWLQKFITTLKELGHKSTSIDEILATHYEDAKEMFLKERDPELAAYSIRETFREAKISEETKRIFEKYSAHHPRIYSTAHCLNVMLQRMDIQGFFHDFFKSQSTGEYPSFYQFGNKLKLYEENFRCDKVTDPQNRYSTIVKILIHQLENFSEKKLSVSVLRSKYSILLELLSAKSKIPLAILNTGIVGDVTQETFDELSTTVDSINESKLFFMDLPEPVELDEFMDQIEKASKKGDFKLIIISGLLYLFKHKNEDKFDINVYLQRLREFSEQNGIMLLIIP